MKFLLLGNQAAAVGNFWIPLLERARETGARALVGVPWPAGARDREAVSRLEAAGADLRYYPLDRKGLNPLRDARTLRALYALMRAERPDILFATTIKPVIWGNLAARLAGIKQRYSMITGLGFAFEADSPAKRLLKRGAAYLYRQALRDAPGIFFQNRDDQEAFFENGILARSQPARLFPEGTGVDVARFSPAPLPAGAPVFLLVGRLLAAKGIREYAEAAGRLKKTWPEARFLLLGSPEQGPGGVSLEELRRLGEGKTFEYVGEASDVRPWIARASALVLPSWREGLPCSLMEGMAMGRCAVATDVPGCRDLVEEGQNGLLAPVRDGAALASRMERLLENPALLETMGRNARAMMEARYDARAVAAALGDAMGLKRG